MEKEENANKISVIIPAYNNEVFFNTCLESVLNQTYNNYEIIVINDGSEDDTLYVARELQKKYNCIKIIDNENRGQGFSRNYALQFARGEYILFLDSDDFLEPVALEASIERIEKDKSDLVVFDWKYYKTSNKTYSYVNKDKFFRKNILEGKECLKLLSIKHYFTVNKLYSKKFLQENDIKYGEGYIYEDIEFWVKVSIRATKVSLIHSPLYNVRISKTSTTKTNHDTNFHCDSYIKAVEQVVKLTKNQKEEEYYYLYKYLIQKFFLYYNKRTPKEYKRKFINDFIKAMKPTELINLKVPNRLTRLYYVMNIFRNERKKLFIIIYKMYEWKKEYKRKRKDIKNKLKSKIKKITRKSKHKINNNIQEFKNSRGKRKEDIILFMGFDYRYTGNSRYLFESVISRRKENVFFVTEDNMVDEEHRIEPNSKEFYNLFYKARIVIFESWISPKLKKTPCAIWIQLWHGTPIKKMLYDSDEKEIISNKPGHKISKFNDIARWNYFLTDNKNINKYFEKAFLLRGKRILSFGYPRVEYLLNNKNNIELKKEIKQKHNLPLDKKIISYLPTWRDYNYGKNTENFKLEYLLNSNQLEKYLNDNYIIISKNHSFLNNNENSIAEIDIETQELLLISDYLITDYSSVMFDAFAIDLPVVLLVKDFKEYMESRGVYEDIWEHMNNFICEDEKAVAKMIEGYDINSNYNCIKEKFCYNNNQKYKLVDYILRMADRKGKLIRNVLIYGEFSVINSSVVKTIEQARQIGNRIVFGIANSKPDEKNFLEQKELLEKLGIANLVIPLEGERPTNEDIKKFDIETVLVDKNDNYNYECNIENIKS